MIKNLAFTWRYLERHKIRFAAGVAALLGRDGIAIAIPLLIREAVSRLASSDGSSAKWLAGAILLAAIPKALLQAFARLRMMYVSRDAEFEMRNDLFTHLMSLEPAFYSHVRTGDLMAHATNDLNSVKLMLGPGLVNLFESMVTLPVAAAVMAFVDWRLTLVALAPLPMAVCQMVYFGRRVHDRSQVIQEQFSGLSSMVEQHIAGVRTVRAFAQEPAEVERFGKLNIEYYEAKRRLAIDMNLADPILNLLTGAASLGVLWYGGREVLASRLNVGDFAMFLTYIATLQRPVAAMGRVVTFLQRGMASIGRLRALFEVRPTIAAPNSALRLPVAVAGEICLQGVAVRREHTDVLRNLNLTIEPGSRVALVGHTGSGKTTLTRLIPRLLDPTSGKVTIDGIDVRELDPRELRAQVGFVPQETFLFSATLAQNIAWGAPAATEPEVREAAKIAGLEDDIAQFPDGYETLVGERGVLLSGGQKQRVAIARAIIRRPRILIFDDALSSVDSLTEQRILDHLEQLPGQPTAIFVTHRLSSIRRADRVYVLEHGEIVEQGSHGELLSRGDRYWRMWNQHQCEEILEATA